MFGVMYMITVKGTIHEEATISVVDSDLFPFNFVLSRAALAPSRYVISVQNTPTQICPYPYQKHYAINTQPINQSICHHAVDPNGPPSSIKCTNAAHQITSNM